MGMVTMITVIYRTLRGEIGDIYLEREFHVERGWCFIFAFSYLHGV